MKSITKKRAELYQKYKDKLEKNHIIFLEKRNPFEDKRDYALGLLNSGYQKKLIPFHQIYADQTVGPYSDYEHRRSVFQMALNDFESNTAAIKSEYQEAARLLYESCRDLTSKIYEDFHQQRTALRIKHKKNLAVLNAEHKSAKNNLRTLAKKVLANKKCSMAAKHLALAVLKVSP